MVTYAYGAQFPSRADGGSAAGEKTREKEAVAHRWSGALFVGLGRES